MIPTPARAALRSVAFAFVALVLVTRPGVRPAAAGPLDMLEGDFEKAISRITPATVECKPYGIPPEQVLGGSSGVIVSRKGYIFSDGDVGSYRKGKQGEKPEVAWSDDVEVRVPDLKGKGFRAYRATVIHRNRKVDTSLLRARATSEARCCRDEATTSAWGTSPLRRATPSTWEAKRRPR